MLFIIHPAIRKRPQAISTLIPTNMSNIESVLSEADCRMMHNKLYAECTDHQMLLRLQSQAKAGSFKMRISFFKLTRNVNYHLKTLLLGC